jgi:hypothetical protein
MEKSPKQILAAVRYRSRMTSYIWYNNWRAIQIIRKVHAHSKLDPSQAPVAFFNASTRLYGVSLNAAFSFLAACGLQLAGVPVVHFACKSGMSRCVLGTQKDNPEAVPPCERCLSQSRWLFANAPVLWFKYNQDENLARLLHGVDLAALTGFEYRGRPLGALVLPGLRWALRRHHLIDDAATRGLLVEYILSAHNIAEEFSKFLAQVQPSEVVLFNGMMYPEATARWVAQQQGLRVITHEVGLQPFSAYFTDGEATAYPIDIPEDFELSPDQNQRLDAYLEKRFQGQFSMAGIRFWPEMSGLSEAFLERMRNYRQVVPVFTNVIFDTSQPHSNKVFPHMFAWLDQVLELIREHPDTLFVLRAHPDENRPGKESHESVAAWVERCQATSLPNLEFFGPNDFISSYELIKRSKFIMVYNSSIGLEGSLMGKAVLCAGKARFTQIPTVFFPPSPEDHREQARTFLRSDQVDVPPEFINNARRFLYYQLFRTSLPFDKYIYTYPYLAGFVKFRKFHWQYLTPQVSETMRVIVDGIVKGSPFLLDDPDTTAPEKGA